MRSVQLFRAYQVLARTFRTMGLKRAIRKNDIRGVVRHFDLDGLGFDMLLLSHDSGLSTNLLYYDWREYRSTKFLIEDFLRKDEVVLDVGANLGYFALIEAVFSPTNKVYAIEPVPDTYAILELNVRLNSLTNVETFRTAIGDHNGEADFLVCEGRNFSRMATEEDVVSPPRGCLVWKRITVPVCTLSEFQKRHMRHAPTMLRMDVEGHEFQIITGNETFFAQNDVGLCIEFHAVKLGKSKSVQLLRRLAALGYAKATIVKDQPYCVLRRPLFEPPIGPDAVSTLDIQHLASKLESMDEARLAEWGTPSPHLFTRKG